MSTLLRRKQKLIQPKLQLRLVGSFVGVAALAMLLQFLVMSFLLARVAPGVQETGQELLSKLPALLLGVLAFSALAVLPFMFAFGVLLTFRVAGPVYRFEQFLAAVARGEQVEPCKLRDGDHLENLCEAINVATEPLREQVASCRSDESESAEKRAA